MKKMFRQLAVRFGYSLIASGIKLPDTQVKLIEDFLARLYLRDLLKRLEINCVLDVGAQNGSFARNLRWSGYDGQIIAFEPNREEFLPLCERFKSDSRWTGLNIALGRENGTQTFNIAKNSLYSSFLTPKTAKIDRTYEVEVKRLDSIFDELIRHVNNPRVFLKVDTQGYDLEVVKGADACIAKILLLQSEVSVQPIYDDMPHYLDSLSYYESLGFQLLDLFTVLRGKKYGNIIEYDCLMARLEEATAVGYGGH
jgi:FkbM family methyltransferase